MSLDPKPPTYFDRDLHDCYQMDYPHKCEKEISYISNQIIHSYIFEFGTSEDRRLTGLFFASDKDRHKFCNWIHIFEICKIFRSVSEDYPSELTMVVDLHGQKHFASGHPTDPYYQCERQRLEQISRARLNAKS